MKNTITLVILIALTSALDAQSLKGKLFLGGNLGLSIESEKDNGGFYAFSNAANYNAKPNTYIEYRINPLLGFYVSNKFALGLQLGHSFYNYENTAFYENYFQGYYTLNSYRDIRKSRTFKIAPLVRYSKSISEKFVFNLNLTLPYSREKLTQQQTSQSNNLYKEISNNFGINISPEVLFFATDKIALSASFGGLGYNYQQTKKSNTYNGESEINRGELNIKYFNLNLSSSLLLGVSFFFGDNK